MLQNANVTYVHARNSFAAVYVYSALIALVKARLTYPI